MFKKKEISEPSSCLNKALDNEMLFVLLGRDDVGADTVRYWIRRRLEAGLNKLDDAQIREAVAAATIMEQQAAQKRAALAKLGLKSSAK